MPKYKCSYAVDVPHYFDFTIEAKNKRQANQLIEQALKSEIFYDHEIDLSACHENECNHRVFLSSRLGRFDLPDCFILVHDNGKFSIVPSV